VFWERCVYPATVCNPIAVKVQGFSLQGYGVIAFSVIHQSQTQRLKPTKHCCWELHELPIWNPPAQRVLERGSLVSNEPTQCNPLVQLRLTGGRGLESHRPPEIARGLVIYTVFICFHVVTMNIVIESSKFIVSSEHPRNLGLTSVNLGQLGPNFTPMWPLWLQLRPALGAWT
jgi:hypothetical protein